MQSILLINSLESALIQLICCRWSNQRSGTDSETEGEDGGLISRSRENGLSVGQPVDLTSRYVGGHGGHTAVGEVPSPQLTLAEFLQK